MLRQQTNTPEALNHGKRLSIDADVRERSTKAYRSQDGTLDSTALGAALAFLGEKCRARGVFEDLTDTLTRLGRALEVFVGADLLADFLTLRSKSDFVSVQVNRRQNYRKKQVLTVAIAGVYRIPVPE